MARGVMIVDDEIEVREAVSRHLIKQGLEAITASGGKECLDYLEKGFTGVVLMDLNMPGMDGWDAIGEIIKRGYAEKTVIVLLTAASGAPPQKAEALKQCVTDYIPKPVDLKKLVEAVKTYLTYFD